MIAQYRSQAEQHLNGMGVSIQQAYDVIMQNLDQPGQIVSMCEQYGVSSKMLAGIANLDLEDVHQFFQERGQSINAILDSDDDGIIDGDDQDSDGDGVEDEDSEETGFDSEAFYDFLMNNLGQPQSIINEANSKGLNLADLAQIAQTSLQDVVNFFYQYGVDYDALVQGVNDLPDPDPVTDDSTGDSNDGDDGGNADDFFDFFENYMQAFTGGDNPDGGVDYDQYSYLGLNTEEWQNFASWIQNYYSNYISEVSQAVQNWYANGSFNDYQTLINEMTAIANKYSQTFETQFGDSADDLFTGSNGDYVENGQYLDDFYQYFGDLLEQSYSGMLDSLSQSGG
ncbi:MAG: hypothetical protein RI556_12640, partial [Hydrogenovibrio sp.]|uniref:hypothetical protein n=1 Tax=Hydrogenovibrio sp. TaxID=2065821 RepID=UPI002870A9F3